MGYKIGDYIHYHYENYLYYGTGTKNHPEKGSPEDAYKFQKSYIMLQAKALITGRNKKSVAEEIERDLNYFRPNNQIFDSKWSEEETRKIEDTIKELVLQRVGESEIEITDNLQGLNMNYTGFDKVGAEGLGTLGESGDKNSIESIQKRLKILTQTLNGVYRDVQNKQVRDLRTKLKNLHQQWHQIYSEGNFLKGQGFFKNTEFISHENLGGFIKDLNEMWRVIKRQVSADATGKIGEYYAAIAKQAASAKGTKTAQDLINYLETTVAKMNDIQLGVVGKQSSTRVYSSAFVSTTGGKENSHLINGLFRDFSGGKFNIDPKQDKVDLKIQLDDLSEINASIKNYNIHQDSQFNLKVHSGSSILALTQEYTYFMNHYLNITAQNKTEYISFNKPIGPMNQVLRMTLALKAISGGILKLGPQGLGFSEKAEVLILNDNSGLYKVYWVDELMGKIIKNVDTYLEIAGLPDNKTWTQNYVVDKDKSRYQNAYSRINNLLAQLHSFKLEISLKPAIFYT